jgi:hypothetical protein
MEMVGGGLSIRRIRVWKGSGAGKLLKWRGDRDVIVILWFRALTLLLATATHEELWGRGWEVLVFQGVQGFFSDGNGFDGGVTNSHSHWGFPSWKGLIRR